MKKWILTMSAWVVVSHVTTAQVIIDHQNDNDPITEGFTKATDNAGAFAFPTNDAGTLAWSIVNPSTDKLLYRYVATPAEQSQLSLQGWQVVAKVHLVSAPDTFNEPTERTAEVHWSNDGGTGYRRYNFRLGISSVNPNDASVFLSVDGGAGDMSFYVPGKGTGFHTWELRRPAGTEVAQLWVDGTFLTPYLPVVDAASAGVFYFGAAGNSGVGQANWAQVILEVPEPSMLALVALGGGCVMLVRSRVARRRA